ncbi:sigma-70 family RNA polymerase sigma factor [Streptomyces libani]
MKQENGTEAVEAAKAGDEEAREQLVAAYLPLIYNVVGRALDGHADVDDVVQETMLRVLESLDGLREPASFRSWLVAIAMNQVRRRVDRRPQDPRRRPGPGAGTGRPLRRFRGPDHPEAGPVRPAP